MRMPKTADLSTQALLVVKSFKLHLNAFKTDPEYNRISTTATSLQRPLFIYGWQSIHSPGGVARIFLVVRTVLHVTRIPVSQISTGTRTEKKAKGLD